MTPRRHGRGGRELGLAGCPSGPTPLVGFDSFPSNMGEATRMFWKDRLPPCQSVPYLLLKMAALAFLPIECPPPLGVAPGPRRRSGVRRFLIRFGPNQRHPRLPAALGRRRWKYVCHPDVCTG